MSYRGDGTGGGRGCGGGRGYGGRGGGGRGYGRRGGDGGGGRGYGGRGGSGGGGRGYGGRGGDGGGGGGRGQYQAPSVGVLSKQTRQEAAVISDVQKKLSLSAPPTAGAGGRNTVLADAVGWNIPILIDKVTIVFGADVTHAPAGEDSSPSIAAVVASMDWPEVTKYRGLVSVQGHREEIIQDLYKEVIDPKMGKVGGGMIRELLVAFRRSTGHKPERIIFYRDGVSEGQLADVLAKEMDATRRACVSLQEDYLPRVTFVVVQKRPRTRLCPVDRNMAIITIVVGSSRPTHYHVLYDENNFTADLLQLLTNSLCYKHARCTCSVSVG